ncbi:GIY-YIG nuclease family protein [Propionibacteriaceae bacterium G57]|uniref:GIY-YIG nuclease family protein n=1 Tax=Aestuariimicrobium sp. G57 TaxID=3418485 RepID=UPI003DA6EF2D
MSGKQLRLFLVDGSPGGLTTAQIMNWTGHVLSGRRSDLGDLLGRPEAQRPGVYLLLGDDEGAVGGVRCYIGEAEDVADRLRSHQRNKTFWDRMVVITSTDENLTKGHIRYLESRLIELAAKASRVELENGTQPPRAPLPEADRSDMDYFVDQLHVILPVLGVNAIRVRDQVPGPLRVAADQMSPVFLLTQTKLGVDARAQQVDGEFIMLTDSKVVASVRQSMRYSPSTARAYASYQALHEKLVANGTIRVEEGVGRLTRDTVFSSPSTAGAIALGRSCNGRAAWISAEGETFGAWESRGVE